MPVNSTKTKEKAPIMRGMSVGNTENWPKSETVSVRQTIDRLKFEGFAFTTDTKSIPGKIVVTRTA